jgi:ABC-type spermidine/putrescine transport system, permease component II
VLALGLYLTFRGLTGGTDLRVLALGQGTLAMPLVFVTVSAGLAAVDPNLSRAAASLGFRWPSIVWHVELPLVRRSVLAGGILAFAVCFDEAVLAYFLSPPGQQTLPTKIWTSASESASPTIAAASALVICLAITLLAVAAVLRPRRDTKGAS